MKASSRLEKYIYSYSKDFAYYIKLSRRQKFIWSLDDININIWICNLYLKKVVTNIERL